MKTIKLLLIGVVVLLWDRAAAQPTVNVQPTNSSVSLGATAQFTAGFRSSGPPMTYQWWFKDTALDTAINPSAAKNALLLTNVTLANAGPYFAVASDTTGSVTSKVAVLEVDPTFVKITQSDIVQGAADMWFPYWVDLEGDGWLELVLAGGYASDGGQPLTVYQNNRDGTLSGTLTHDLSKIAMQFGTLAWADLDNDGDLDVFAAVLEKQTPILFRNEGGGHFTRIVADASWTANRIAAKGASATCADFDNDGILDLLNSYWGNYATGTWGTNTVLHGVGNGRFEVDRASALALSHTWTENWSWADWNGDGRLDLFGATSWDTNQVDLMFQNIGSGQFLRITNSLLAQVPDVSVNAAWGDYNNDGNLDVCVTSLYHTNQIYRSLGNGIFEPDPASPNFPSFPTGGSRLVAIWGDYDNDGWLDLFISHNLRASRLFHNRGDGSFEEITKGSPVTECQGFGSAWGDYDNDGFLDLCVVHPNINKTFNMTYLYRNNLRAVGNTNGWLKVKLVGAASNRDGIGAIIRIKTTVGGKELWQMRQIACQSYQAELLSHFGLGDATRVETLRIRWPSGLVQELHDVPPNQSLRITEHQEAVTYAPNLTASSSPSGTVQLTLTGQTNLLYVFEASTNLVQWTKVAVRTNLTGTVDFTDKSAINSARLFYRGVVP